MGVVSESELHALLVRTLPSLTVKQSAAIYEELLAGGYDTNGDGQISVEELAMFWVENKKGYSGTGPAPTQTETALVQAINTAIAPTTASHVDSTEPAIAPLPPSPPKSPPLPRVPAPSQAAGVLDALSDRIKQFVDPQGGAPAPQYDLNA